MRESSGEVPPDYSLNSIALNPKAKNVYVALRLNEIIIYSVVEDGKLKYYTKTADNLDKPNGITFFTTKTNILYAYITNLGNNTLVRCQVNDKDGKLEQCRTIDNLGLSQPYNIAFSLFLE